MVRVSKSVAEKRKALALNMVKNLEPIAELDDNADMRQAALIVIRSLERTAYGGKSRTAFTNQD